jgi:hypothetical protein
MRRRRMRRMIRRRGTRMACHEPVVDIMPISRVAKT